MFLQLLLLSVILVAIAVVGLAFNLIFRKHGKFPETGVGHNPEMRKLGLSCAKTDELRQFQLGKKIATTKAGQDSVQSEWSGCAGCSCD